MSKLVYLHKQRVMPKIILTYAGSKLGKDKLGRCRSIETNLIIEEFGTLRCGHDHLIEHRLLFLEFSELLLEVGILFLLVDHAQLERPVECLDEGASGISNLIVGVLDFVAHALELLPEQLNQLVVLLQVLVSFPHQILSIRRVLLRPCRGGRLHWWSCCCRPP